MWILAAILSALFAGITAILTKCGVKETNSDVATAVRTFVVLIFAWIIVFLTGAHATLSEISARSWIYLILSGLATGASSTLLTERWTKSPFWKNSETTTI